jgi:putative hydrolase of the HAD superfamily
LNLKHPKGVLLDLDDTILSMNAYVDRCWREVSAHFAERNGRVTTDNLLAAIDEVRAWYWSDLERHRLGRLNLDRARQEVVEIALKRLGIDDHSLAADVANSYGKEIEKYTRPFPGAIETLKSFNENGIPLALVTNGATERQRNKIRRFELEPFFDSIVIEEEFGCGKPDERVFQHALSRLKVDTKDAWMIGDDLARDVAGAQQLGIFSIWVDWQNKGLPDQSPVRPDRIIISIAELA